MTQTALQTTGLSYRFATNVPILKDISLNVPEASIYGFLGPNGAGKTTTLRLILGLLKKQGGNITVLGKGFEDHRVEILRKTGSLIESPSLYGHLTAYENLRLLQVVYRCSKQRIQTVLDMVGLPDTGSKKANQFSLGMKQRLGIAIALLNDPQLLILDEPTNGLDPNGIIEIRELLKKLNREQGTTIIISSHLLGEIEKLVSHTGIISKGKMVFQGTLEDLKTRQRMATSILFETNEMETALRIFKSHGIEAEVANGFIKTQSVPKHVVARINQQLVNNGVEVYAIQTGENDLETIFMNLINQ